MSRERGFTLLELTFSMVVLAVGVLATAATLGSLTKMGDERTVESQRTILLRNAIAILKEAPFEDAVEVFSGQTSQFVCHPDGSVTFTPSEDSTGVGTFEFFTNEQSVPESFADLSSGFDLNGNGVIDATPVDDYRVLPVRITISLESRGVDLSSTTDLLFRKW